jgi:hypothetical protein
MRRKLLCLLAVVDVGTAITVFVLACQPSADPRPPLVFSFAGTTNIGGEAFVCIVGTNVTGTMLTHRSAGLPWECRARTANGWTNFSNYHFSGPGCLKRGERFAFKVPLPAGARRWQVGLCSDKADLKTKILWRVGESGLDFLVPELIWKLVPDGESRDCEAWSPMFAFTPPH